MAITHYIDTTAPEIARARIKSTTNRVPESFPTLIYGDTRNHNFVFYNSQTGSVESFSGNASYSLRVTIGQTQLGPTSGTYTLTCGANTTGLINALSDADTISQALNALAQITTDGGVVVTGTFPNFLVTWRNIGAVTGLSSNAALLIPASSVSLVTTQTGSATVANQVAIVIRQSAISSQSTWTLITSPQNGWTGTLTTNTAAALILLSTQGQKVGEFVEVGTCLTAEVLDSGGTPISYYQTPIVLRAKNLDPSNTTSPAFSSYNLGDTLYGNSSNTLSRLPGATTTQRKFYSQAGDGTNSAQPNWVAIQASDLPNTELPGGTNQSVQFNDSNSFGGDSTLAYNKATKTIGSSLLNYVGAFFEGANQPSAPSTPTNAGRIFFDSLIRLAWKVTGGKIVTLDGTANTADRVYTLQDQNGTVALLQGLDITYTGTPVFPINLNAISNGVYLTGTNPGRQTYLPVQGVSVGFMNYSEGTTTWGSGLGITSITFHNIVQAGGTGGITFDGCNLCTSISWPALVEMQNSYSPNGFNLLTTLSLPNLAFVGGNFSPTTCPVLTTLDTPSLVSVKGTYSPNTMASLTTLKADNLAITGNSFLPTVMGSLTSLSFPALTQVGGSFGPATMASLTSWNFPSLTTVGLTFNPGDFAALTSMTMPALVTVGAANAGGNFAPSTMASLTTLSAVNLTTVNGNFAPTTMAALTSLTFNALQTITGTFAPTTMASCTTVSLSGMVNYGSTITIPSANMGAVSTLTLGTVGTLKSIGGNITLSGLALNQTSVDNCLKLVASLDGTSGTTSWGTGKTLVINGGTNASPTTTGTTTQTSAGSNFSASGTTCTANVNNHGLTNGDYITITGITTLTNANVTAAIATVVNANQFTFPIVSQTATGGGTATIRSTHANGTDGFHYCQVIRLRGATVTTALGF